MRIDIIEVNLFCKILIEPPIKLSSCRIFDKKSFRSSSSHIMEWFKDLSILFWTIFKSNCDVSYYL